MSTETTGRRLADRAGDARPAADADARIYARRIDCAGSAGFPERRGGNRGRGDALHELRSGGRHLD